MRQTVGVSAGVLLSVLLTTGRAWAQPTLEGQPKYARTAIVAERGGDYVYPLHAMNDLSTWCPLRSETERCLLKIMPGVHSTGDSILVMQPYVDIEGSGVMTTVLQGAKTALRGAKSSQLRHLTVRAGNAVADSPWGVDNRSGAPQMVDVTVEVQGTGTPIGIFNEQGSPVLTDVTVKVSGGTLEPCGIKNVDSAAVMRNVAITVTGQSTSVAFALRNDGTTPPEMNNVRVAASGGRVNYGVFTSSGRVSNPLRMFDVTAAAAGGATSTNTAVYNQGVTEMVRVTAEASGGSLNRAIANHGFAVRTLMVDVVASASGPTTNEAIYNQFDDQSHGKEIEMTNVSVDASGGTDRNYGIFNDAPSVFSGGVVTLDHSRVAGTTAAIYNVSQASVCAKCRLTIRAAYTKLEGPVSTSGALASIACIGVYRGPYVVLDATCQAVPGEARGLGESCTSDRQCKSWNCVDRVCCDEKCEGHCRSCNLDGHRGACTAVRNGSDPRRACQIAVGGQTACGGACYSGQCAFPDIGTPCGLCAACDGIGRCTMTPPDDGRCGIIECSGLDIRGRVYQDLTWNRCSALGSCKAPNDPATCTVYTERDD